MYDSIIFDLDGTLWDAADACSKGWNKALIDCDLGHIAVSANDIRGVSGLPFQECVSTMFSGVDGLDYQKLSEAIDREEMHHVSLFGGELYDGVVEGIVKLSEGFPLFLISNCQSWYLESFWENHKMKHHFRDHDCHGNSGVSKSEMIKKMCREKSLGRTIYVGDTRGDQISSREAGVEFAFAEYGFGKTSEPELSFSNFTELTTKFLKWSQDANNQKLIQEK